VELSITHEALSRWVMALVVGVKTLEKVVAAEKKLAQRLFFGDWFDHVNLLVHRDYTR
jgi:hypothetical protein